MISVPLLNMSFSQQLTLGSASCCSGVSQVIFLLADFTHIFSCRWSTRVVLGAHNLRSSTEDVQVIGVGKVSNKQQDFIMSRELLRVHQLMM